MKKFLLYIGVWVFLAASAFASDERSPMPFSENYYFSADQDAPVYPNPARDHIYVRLSEESFSNDVDPTIEIRNILGNKMPVQVERTSQNIFRVSLSNFPSGYYMLVLQCERCGTHQGSQKEIHKFLKQ